MTFRLFLYLVWFSLLATASYAQPTRWCFSASDVLPTVEQPRRELRGVWLTTLSNLDWPSRPATTSQGEVQQRAELCRILDGLKASGINVVFFQTRVRGTVVYPSSIEPWDACITGTPGRAPGYDPLQFVIDECHKRQMQLHAWVVAYPIHKAATAKRLGSQALSKCKPSLCQLCGDQWMMDPGVPGTAEHIAAVCAEIVRRYDVDGINLDYIRYPESSIPFRDDATYRKYGAGQSRLQWRRENVTRTVRAIHNAVRAIKPWVCLSCSPVGKYADLPLHSARGWNARDAVAQDAVAWLNEGIMDLLLPMMYFTGEHFYPFAVDWSERSHQHTIAPGLGIYFLSAREKNWPLETITREMNFLRSLGQGQAYFRAKFLLANEKGLLRYCTNRFYSREALVPPLVSTREPLPAMPRAEISEQRWTLHLSWPPVEGAEYYNVYRLSDQSDDLEYAQPLAYYLRETHYDYTPALPTALWTRIAVTACDRYGRESVPAILAAAQSDTLPTQDTRLVVPDTLNCAVLIVDKTGRTIRRLPRGRHELYIGRLEPGFYQVLTDERQPQLLKQFWKN